MKTAIKVYIGIAIVSNVISLIAICVANFLLGVLMIPVAILNLVIPFAVLRCLEENEEQQAELYELRDKLNRMSRQYPTAAERDDIHGFAEGSFTSAPLTVAKHRWACVKCQTVNREGTMVCENCGAHYSAEQTDLYNAPLTRWKLKDKKKK